MASIVFKNIVSKTRDENTQVWLWLTLDPTLRQQIKEGLLGQLGSQSEAYIKNASLCLASIAHIELPQGQWD